MVKKKMVILNLNVYFINVYNVKFCNKIMIIRFVLYLWNDFVVVFFGVEFFGEMSYFV